MSNNKSHNRSQENLTLQTFDLAIKITMNSDIRFQIIENLKSKRIFILDNEDKALNNVLKDIIESDLYINYNSLHLKQLIENYFAKNGEEYLLDNCEKGLFITV